LKNYLPYCFFYVLLLTGLNSCRLQTGKQLPSLTESYRKTDKMPFGSFIAYKKFQSEFPDYWINIADKPFENTWDNIKRDTGTKYSLYFLITKNLILTSGETNAMLEYVKAGNDLFISADYVDKKLLDSIYCKISRKGEIINEINGEMHDTHVGMYFGDDFKQVSFSYYYFPFLNYFTSYDTTFARVLGVNENNQPDYILLFSGKGRLYLHLAPRIFSNYFLLTNDNYHYFEYVTAYLRFDPRYIYWDEYYKNISSLRKNNPDSNSNNDNKGFSTLSVIKRNPSLLWAFYIALAGILLYVIFNIKRKQREIDIVKPNSNTTLAFTETIGKLYYQNLNNRHIADKMITYFYEHIRNKYFINTALVNNEFINSLAGKSGVSQKETEELFTLVTNIREKDNVTDQELLQLNLKIENFTKTKT
jgi:hypothetical protein